jgi:uncharacterized membrane protein
MITLEHVYILLGLFFAAYAVLEVLDAKKPRRIASAAFWGLLAGSFLFGSHFSPLVNGIVALGLILLAGFGALSKAAPQKSTNDDRREKAQRYGNWLLAPALIIPLTALVGTLFLAKVTIGSTLLLDSKQTTLVALGLGVVIAFAVAMLWLRPPLLTPLQEGRRLVNSIGWAAILPQMLASLGAVLALAGVGNAVGHIATEWFALDQPLNAVVVYCVGMAVFTAMMGNAFAAFPVMTAAIGVPLIVHKFGGNPAILGAIGMVSGYCGTLTTPLAANFNIVPAALLELPDRHGVIKVQIPTAIPLLLVNIALMYFLVFRY